MKKILWLASWYPNENDPFNGDFIKRQAEAVAMYQPLKIIYVGKSTTSHLKHEDIQGDKDNLQETILYYPTVFPENTFFSKLRSLYAYFKMHTGFLRSLKKKNELPDLVHVHVAMKAGIIALYLKWKYKIPYVLTEHWSGYYPQSEDTLFKKSFLKKYLTKKILRDADLFLPVSRSLGNQVSQHWVHRSFQEIPNVVNTGYFFPAENPPPDTFRFIHVSTLLYHKNPAGIIRAFSELANDGADAELILVGPLNAAINKMLQENKFFKNKIHCTGEISYEMVGTELRKSSAFVLFSMYENMPCVILEALCTGIPVLATRVGGIPEMIGDENGILIEAGNEQSLLDAMRQVVQNYHTYNHQQIAEKARTKYSYETIGKKIVHVYESVLPGSR